jgi:hypothetical protein
MTQMISIHSYRGGTGKFNLTANLATTEFLLLIRRRVISVHSQEVFNPICLLNEIEILSQIPPNNTLIANL